MRRYFKSWIWCIVLLTLVVYSCKNDQKNASENKKAEEQINYQAYPPLPVERRQALIKYCDAIDIIYYNLPISMNQDDPQSVLRNIYFTMDVGLKVNPDCKALGHIIYLSKGDVLEEADIYFSEGCKFYMFMEDAKPAYANMMSKLGDTFFSNVLMQVKGKKFPGLK